MLLYCIRINGLSLVTFDTSEYLGGNTEKVSEISSAFGYLLDAENQLSVLKTTDVVTGPDYSLVGKGLCRECPSFFARPPLPAVVNPSLTSLGSYSNRRSQGRSARRTNSCSPKDGWAPLAQSTKGN